MAVELNDQAAVRIMQGVIDLMDEALDAAKGSSEDHSEIILNYATALQALKESTGDLGEHS